MSESPRHEANRAEKPVVPGTSTVRLAGLSDEAALFDICRQAFDDNGLGRFDEANVRRILGLGCRHKEGVAFGVIDGPQGFEGVIGLVPTKLWYSSDWYYTDLLLYVVKDKRRSRHAARLLEFAQWWAKQTGAFVELGIATDTRLDAKEKLLGRFAKRTGSYFVISPFDPGAAQ